VCTNHKAKTELAMISMMLALGVLLLAGCSEGVTYYMTVRDFIPSACLRASEFTSAWGSSHPISLTDQEFTDKKIRDNMGSSYGYEAKYGYPISVADVNASLYCPYSNYIFDGLVSGHPDFEMEGARAGGSSKCYKGGLAQTCKAINSIISPNMTKSTGGLMKMKYCSDGDEDRCGKSTDSSSSMYASSRGKYFKSWYHDVQKYNKRTGTSLELEKVTDGVDTGLFIFDSYSLVKDRYFKIPAFAPLNEYRESVTQETYPDPFRAPVWPNSLVELEYITNKSDTNYNRGGSKMWYTTEVHTYFEYRGNETFKFSGDDDFWAFINGKLAIDIGGVHGKESDEIKLDTYAHEEALNLTVGKVYTMDIFHAERHFKESNFKITTSLSTACNVAEPGSAKLQFSQANAANEDIFTSLSSSFENGMLNLVQSDSAELTSVFAFTANRHNVGTGFVTEFDIHVNDESASQGFTVVVHQRADGLDDLPKSTGSGLGFAHLTNAVAVVFDLCFNFSGNEACNEQQVGVYYNGENPDSQIDPRMHLHVYDNIMRDFRGETHRIRIEYLEYPDWLQVYIDDSLYLRQENFNLSGIIGGRDAYVGFTSTTSRAVTPIQISDWDLYTVSIDPSKSQFEQSSNPKFVLADGVSNDGFSLMTYDFCNNTIEYGGFSSMLKGVFVEILQGDTYSNGTSRRLQSGNLEPLIINATIVDNLDGTYSVTLNTKSVASFALYICVGVPCDIEVAIIPRSNGLPSLTEVTYSNALYSSSIAQAITMIALTQTPSKSPTTSAPTAALATDEAVKYGSVIAGVAGGIALISILFLVAYRKQWRRDKSYIDDGKIHRIERDLHYNKDDEFTKLGGLVLSTRDMISKERSRATVGNEHGSQIVSLQLENEALQEQVRVEKIKATMQGGNMFTRAKRNVSMRFQRKEF